MMKIEENDIIEYLGQCTEEAIAYIVSAATHYWATQRKIARLLIEEADAEEECE